MTAGQLREDRRIPWPVAGSVFGRNERPIQFLAAGTFSPLERYVGHIRKIKMLKGIIRQWNLQ